MANFEAKYRAGRFNVEISKAPVGMTRIRLALTVDPTQYSQDEVYTTNQSQIRAAMIQIAMTFNPAGAEELRKLEGG
jgi:hypothetical protein